MVANLFGDRYIEMRRPAWHSLGITLPDDQQVTAAEAFKLAKLDYKYHILPIGAVLPDGTVLPTSDQMMVYREPTADDPFWRKLGVVSAGYRHLQNEELALGIDAISKKTGWRFETAGALAEGGTVFVCLKANKQSIHGDEVDSYFLVSDGKAANRALRISVTPVRVVCQNTLIASDSSSSLGITIPHTSSVTDEYAVWLDLISGLEKSQQDTFADLRAMGEVKLTTEQRDEIFSTAFPDPTANQRVRLAQQIPNMPGVDKAVVDRSSEALASATTAYEYNMVQARKWRAGCVELYEKFNAGNEQGGKMSASALEKLRGTAYAALQAVTELCDYGGTNRDSVASAALFGERAAKKARAWDSALRIAKASSN